MAESLSSRQATRREGYGHLFSLFLVLVCAAVFVASCSALPPETVAELLAPLVAKGTITQAQATAIVSAVTEGVVDWSWLETIGGHALTLVLGYLGIRTWRGTPNARKGSAPSGPD